MTNKDSITKEQLSRALDITRNLDVDYGNKSASEIKELDDALDIIFNVAKEKLRMLESSISNSIIKKLTARRMMKLDETLSLYRIPISPFEGIIIKMSPDLRDELLASIDYDVTIEMNAGDSPIKYKGVEVKTTIKHGENYLAVALLNFEPLNLKTIEKKIIEIKEEDENG